MNISLWKAKNLVLGQTNTDIQISKVIKSNFYQFQLNRNIEENWTRCLPQSQ